jgi:hypothetical protein
MKIAAFAALTATAILAATLVGAQTNTPRLNIDPAKHPNLAAAQDLSRQAFEKIGAAKRANDWDMNGHASRAMDMLVQVNEELSAAAAAANKK